MKLSMCRITLPLLCVLFLCFVSACAVAQEAYSAAPSDLYNKSATLQEAGTAVVLERGHEDPSDSSGAPVQRVHLAVQEAQVVARMVVYNGRLVLSHPKPEEGVEKARALVRTLGGYEQRMTKTEIVLRVPVARFQEAVEAVIGLGDVLDKEIEARDVTEEFFDLKTRLENKEVALARLKALYEQATVEESLKIEKHLERVREEVERLKGRLQLLQSLAALSTLWVRFDTPRVEPPPRVQTALPISWLRGLGLEHLLKP